MYAGRCDEWDCRVGPKRLQHVVHLDRGAGMQKVDRVRAQRSIMRVTSCVACPRTGCKFKTVRDLVDATAPFLGRSVFRRRSTFMITFFD